ncbi:glycoside hydrolase family 3 protein [Teratosphaeria destructans]|uniref:Glycoside hydrolase family 3 protein n=1 Tax=Teratosphaeria destructans TaxID=418781 RepID=A0A9W7SRC4_9PEZI|nr:glycoside hydrolase family 3 protein [Teratosphaeria destructans]
MLEHYTSSRSIRANFDGAAFSSYALMNIVVSLQLWGHVQRNGFSGLGWNDGFVILALASANVFFWASVVGVRPWVGLHYPTQVSDRDLGTFLQSAFVAQLAMATSPFFSKAALLVLYWRLFSVKRRTYLLILWLVLLLWFLGTLLGVLLPCNLMGSAMGPTHDGKACFHKHFWIGSASTGIATDIALLAMPVSTVWKLNASFAQRFAVIRAFGLGAFVTIVTVFRLANTVSEKSRNDPTYDYSDSMIWIAAEIHCSVICSCLPTIRPATRGLLKMCRNFTSHSYPPQQQAPDGTRRLPPPIPLDTTQACHGKREHSLWRGTVRKASIPSSDGTRSGRMCPDTQSRATEDEQVRTECLDCGQANITVTVSAERDTLDLHREIPGRAIEIRKDYTMRSELA